MTIEEIAFALEGRKNKFFTIEVKRPANLRAAFRTLAIEKKSVYQGIECDYSRRGPVREALEAGTRDAPLLPSHIEEVFYEGEVKFWRGKNGQIYFPMPLAGNNVKSVWLRDGEPVPLDDIKEYLLGSEIPKFTIADKKSNAEENGQVIFNAIKIENVMAIR